MLWVPVGIIKKILKIPEGGLAARIAINSQAGLRFHVSSMVKFSPALSL
jgi:hypothetical protein